MWISFDDWRDSGALAVLSEHRTAHDRQGRDDQILTLRHARLEKNRADGEQCEANANMTTGAVEVSEEGFHGG